jgi:uncharacterized protein (TIGR02147 family)
MPSIFKYIDYRKFLSDYYSFKKKTSSAFSYRYFSAKAGFGSPVFLKLVIEGKRNLSRASIEKFCKALQLTKKEALYFKNLALFDQAKTADEKQEHYAVLRSIENTVIEKVLEADQYDYFENWYNVVIRELITLFDFRDDYDLLGRSVYPPIAPVQAEKSAELLKRLNLIREKKDGTYEQTDFAITTSGEIGLLAVRRFNQEMVALAARTIDRLPRDKRNVSGITIGISPSMYNIICSEIAAFKDRVVSLVNRDEERSRVFQLNVQLFPMSEDAAVIRTKKAWIGQLA